MVDEKFDDFDAETHKLEPKTLTKFEKAVSDLINETKLDFQAVPDPKTETKLDFPTLKPLIDPGLNKPFPK